MAYKYKYVLKEIDKFLNYEVKLDELTQEHINNFSSHLHKINIESTAFGKFVHLFTAFGYARENGYMSKYSLFKKPPITVVETEAKFLLKDEFTVLLNNCRNQDLHDIVQTAFMTGMRQSELTNLRWEQVSLERRCFTLDNRKYRTKTRKVMAIPLNDTVMRLVQRRLLTRNKCEYVFTYEGHKWSEYVGKLFRDLVQETFGDNTGLNFHSLRHSFASNTMIEGGNLYVVSKLLGHSSITTTQRYSHLNNAALHREVKLIDIDINKRKN
jgi:integrase